MTLTTWQDDMATGNEEIDTQHKDLLHRVNDLLVACKALRGKEEIGRILWFLKGYVRRRFRAEEKFQARYGFPGYQAHKAEHYAFFREVRHLEALHAKDGASTLLIVKTTRMMCLWLRGHFNRMDKELAAFMRDMDTVGHS